MNRMIMIYKPINLKSCNTHYDDICKNMYRHPIVPMCIDDQYNGPYFKDL